MTEAPARITRNMMLGILALAALNSSVFSIPFIKYVFYDQMIAMTGATNEQLGWLMTIFGIGEVITMPIGGLLADKFNTRKILTVCGLSSGALCLVLAAAPSYTMTAIVWFALIFTSLFMFWSSLFKALRLLGPDEVQGKVMGFYYGANGIGYCLVNIGLVQVCDSFSGAGLAAGMQAVFVALGAWTIVAALIVFFVLGALEKTYVQTASQQHDEVRSLSLFQQMKIVARYKTVWFAGITLFCVYGTMVSMSYFTPYFSDVLGVTVTFSSFIAVLRMYGMQAIGSPVGGVWADKVHSSAKIVIVCCVGSIVCLLAVMLLPRHLVGVAVVTAIVFIGAWFNGMSYGVQYAIPAEGFVPPKYMASAIGFASCIGFIPDVFQHTLFGYWLDEYGAEGYAYIFIYGCVVSAVCIVALALFLKGKPKMKREYMNDDSALAAN